MAHNPKRNWFRFSLRTLFTVVMVPVLACHSLVTTISPLEMTLTAMGETSFRIGIYLAQNGTLPEDLDVLPIRAGYANQTTDNWGQPLEFQVDNDQFTLTSLGRDGVASGTGDDADLITKYRVVDGEVKGLR